MPYPPEHKVAVYAQAVRGLIALESDPEKRLKYLDFIDIYAALEDNERARYQRDYSPGGQDHEPICRTLSRGGYATRHAAGRGPGSGTAAATEIRNPTRNSTATYLEQANEQTLLEWSERILTADRLDEVLH